MKTFRRQPSSLPVIYICNSLTRVNIITRLFNCKMLRIFSKILDHTRLPKITPLGNSTRFDYRFFSHNLHKRKCSNQRGNGAKNRIKRFDIHMNRGSTQLPTERHTTKNQMMVVFDVSNFASVDQYHKEKSVAEVAEIGVQV
ncbi:uncharacterized protein LOC113349984 isoform X2 [Papaver somniferum]|uniref:uncharacterized protein LOC113349984 isoform X2 n=1 Tax=Papaver somniferum TaxID=3469 RepID=UPI000E70127D|nr:uncharacterized protein LOC113349984 isoform X2 [Papaver somniferum]